MEIYLIELRSPVGWIPISKPHRQRADAEKGLLWHERREPRAEYRITVYRRVECAAS